MSAASDDERGRSRAVSTVCHRLPAEAEGHVCLRLDRATDPFERRRRLASLDAVVMPQDSLQGARGRTHPRRKTLIPNEYGQWRTGRTRLEIRSGEEQRPVSSTADSGCIADTAPLWADPPSEPFTNTELLAATVH